METSLDGMRTLWISLVVLGVTTVVQAVIVALSGSVALFGDTVHNAADALTAVPLGIAFLLGRRAADRRYTYGYGRAEDLAGVLIVATIAASAVLAAWTGVDRLPGLVPRRLRARLRRAARRDRADRHRGVGRRPRPGPGRTRRQLLRPRRTLPAGHHGRLPDRPAPGPRGGAAHRLRTPHRPRLRARRGRRPGLRGRRRGARRPRPAPAAVLRTGAAVVPGPHLRHRRVLSPLVLLAGARRTGPHRLAAGPGRPGRPPRGAAHRPHRARGTPRAGGVPAGRRPAALGAGARGRRGTRPRGRTAPARRGLRHPPLRPRPTALAALGRMGTRRRRPRRPDQPAPRGDRRLVQERPARRTRPALPRTPAGRERRAAAAARAVRRLRRLAARPRRQRRHGAPTRLLGSRARRRACARPAHRPAPSRRVHRPGRSCRDRPAPRPRRPGRRPGTGARGQPLHGAARRRAGRARPLDRTGRHLRRHPRRRP